MLPVLPSSASPESHQVYHIPFHRRTLGVGMGAMLGIQPCAGHQTGHLVTQLWAHIFSVLSCPEGAFCTVKKHHSLETWIMNLVWLFGTFPSQEKRSSITLGTTLGGAADFMPCPCTCLGTAGVGCWISCTCQRGVVI